MPSVRMATNDAADMCLSMKIPLLSLKVEDKDVRDHFDIMHLAKDGKKHLENGNKYLSNVYKLYIHTYVCAIQCYIAMHTVLTSPTLFTHSN